MREKWFIISRRTGETIRITRSRIRAFFARLIGRNVMSRVLAAAIVLAFAGHGQAFIPGDIYCPEPAPKPAPQPVKHEKVKVKAKAKAVAKQSQSQAQFQSVAASQSFSIGDGAFSVPAELEVFDKSIAKLHDLPANPDFQRYSGRQGDDYMLVNAPWLKRAVWNRESVSLWRNGGQVILYPAFVNEDMKPIGATRDFSVVSRGSGEWLGDGYLETKEAGENIHDVWAKAVPELLAAGAEEVVIVRMTIRDRTTGDTKSIGLGGGGGVSNNGHGQAAFTAGSGIGWSWGYAENVEIVKAAVSYYRRP